MTTRDVVLKYRGSLGVWLGVVVVLAAVFGPGVVTDLTRNDLKQHVQAGASVDGPRGDPGNVTVRWTANQNADNLTVWAEGPANVAGPTNTSRVVLEDVGEVVAFEETRSTGTNQSVTVYVVAATDGRERTRWAVVVKEEVTL